MIKVIIKSFQHYCCFFLLIILFNCSHVNSQSSYTITSSHSTEALTYFKEIALGSEFNSTSDRHIIKWQNDVNIYVKGNSPLYLRRELNNIIKEINGLIAGISLKVVQTPDQANLTLLIGSPDELLEIEPSAKAYVQENRGLFFVYYNSNFEIYRASVFVDIRNTKSIKAQKHLLREELTQSLGLMKDSYQYPESIFYAKWSLNTRYTELDKLLIQILYHPLISPGITEEDIEKTWKKL